MTPETTEQVAWNLSLSLLQEIGNLLKTATTNIINRKPAQSFEAMFAVRMRVIQSLKNTERSELLNLEKKIKRYIILTREEVEELHLDIYQKATRMLYEELDNYNTKLMDLLNQYGYLLQKKEDTTKMAA